MSAVLKQVLTPREEREEVFLVRRADLLKRAMVLTGNRWDAEDLLQDCFIQFTLVERGEIQNVDGYLRRMLTYMSRRSFQKLTRRSECALPFDLPSNASPHDAIEQIERLNAVRRQLKRVRSYVDKRGIFRQRPLTKKVFILRFWKRHSPQQIAAELGMKRHTVDQHILMARRELSERERNKSPRPEHAPSLAAETHSRAGVVSGKVRAHGFSD
jgi:RNA polymerase sigma factor (sigma-70 family)